MKGKIGGSTHLRTAKEAGVVMPTRKQRRATRLHFQRLEQIHAQAAIKQPADLTPRLRKK